MVRGRWESQAREGHHSLLILGHHLLYWNLFNLSKGREDRKVTFFFFILLSYILVCILKTTYLLRKKVIFIILS